MSEAPVTLITGGSAGIGASIARSLLDRGHRVAVTGRSAERLERFAKDAGSPDALLTLPGDAADHTAVRAAVDTTVERFGRLDNAVANAGFSVEGNLATGDPATWEAMVLTNVLGPMLLVNAALPALRSTRGRIVLVGSVAGYTNRPGNVYGATKWAISGLAENTRRLVTGDGVGVTHIAPGRVDTDFWTATGGAPEGAYLSAQQIADAVVWALAQPAGVDVNTVVIRPIGQDV
jgi:NADP-dependent 3-hydroxy acid dehydrogenase YdfG